MKTFLSFSLLVLSSLASAVDGDMVYKGNLKLDQPWSVKHRSALEVVEPGQYQAIIRAPSDVHVNFPSWTVELQNESAFHLLKFKDSSSRSAVIVNDCLHVDENRMKQNFGMKVCRKTSTRRLSDLMTGIAACSYEAREIDFDNGTVFWRTVHGTQQADYYLTTISYINDVTLIQNGQSIGQMKATREVPSTEIVKAYTRCRGR